MVPLLFKHDKVIEMIFFVVTIGGIGVVKSLNSLANLISPRHPMEILKSVFPFWEF